MLRALSQIERTPRQPRYRTIRTQAGFKAFMLLKTYSSFLNLAAASNAMPITNVST